MILSPTRAEMRHLIWKHYGLRVGHDLTKKQLDDVLMLRVTAVPVNPVNIMRDKITAYIKANKSRLSLPCDGDCYNHSDGVVMACWELFNKEENRGESKGA